MLPKIILHIGCSVDGRIDWIKPDNFLYYRLIRDWKMDAMISGSTTMLEAEMSTENNIEKLDNQYLVVVDSKGRINNWDLIKKQAWWNDTPIVLCSQTTPKEYIVKLKQKNIHTLVYGKTNVDLTSALKELKNRFKINVLRIDSGGILAGVLLRQNLVHEISVLISPQLTGGTSNKTIYIAPDLTTFEGVIDLKLIKCEVLENNYVWLRYATVK
ncbi:MAG: dihydrofolate reductase family protein [Spirochaetales bacterium]|nr:dihydrofolate reductase family protein [Spirochaetales bacterium]